MNKDILEGRLKQMRGEAKVWWGKFIHNDLERAAGEFDVLDGLLQEKYAYTRQGSADEIKKRVAYYEANLMIEPEPATSETLEPPRYPHYRVIS